MTLSSTIPSQRIIVPVLCLLAALGILSTSLYLPSLPAVGKDLGVSDKAVQLTLAIFFLGSAVGSLLLGPLADRYGRLFVAKGGLILFILASFWCAEAQGIESLYIARFLQGFAASSGSLVARAVGRDLFEGPSLIKFSATIMMVISVSPAIAPFIGGFIQSYLGWEKNFYFLMIFGLIVAYLVWNKLPETKKAASHSVQTRDLLRNYGYLLKDTDFVLACSVLGIQMLTVFYYVAVSPYLFISLYGWSPQEYGFIGIASAFGNMTGFAISRRLAHRLPSYKGIIIGNSLCLTLSLGFAVTCLLFHVQAYHIILFSILFYGFSALATVNASAAAMNIYPQMAGASAAIVGAVQIGSGAFGSALASLLPISPLTLALTTGALSLVSLGIGEIMKKLSWLGR